MGDDALRAAQSPTQPEQGETHYTLHEAAEDLGIDVAVLHLAVKARTLECSHHFGRHMLTRGELERYRLQTQPPVTAPEAETTGTAETADNP